MQYSAAHKTKQASLKTLYTIIKKQCQHIYNKHTQKTNPQHPPSAKPLRPAASAEDRAAASIPLATTAPTPGRNGHSAGGMGKIQRVQDDINEVTDMMRANIEAVVDRGEHLELLVDKSDALGSQAQAFQKQSVGLRKAMWWQNMKMVFALAFIVLFILALILFTTCGWALKKCRASQ